MKPIIIPKSYNYIAAFLTFRCGLGCHYCINRFEKGRFPKGEISGKEWVRAINRIVSRDDLPITLQGGEPSAHPDFIYILNNIKKELNIDILTNLQFDVDNFIKNVDPERIKRNAPYASIRVSYHPLYMDLKELIKRTLKMQEAGFSIGLFGVLHPEQEKIVLDAQKKCNALGIDFRTKEFLGEYKGRLYGTYRYNGACEKKFNKKAICRTTEFIAGPNGSIYKCHSDLYENREPVGNMLDPGFEIDDKFKECGFFGHCNPCDVKVKTNRFQEFGHTSVEIKEINEKE